MSTSPMSCWPPGCRRSRTLAELAIARNRWFTPHTWTNGIGLLANLAVSAGVGGGPFLEFPYDPPGWTPERRDFMLAEPIRPDADGLLHVPAAPGLGHRPGRRRHQAVRRMTATPRATVEDWLARAADVDPRRELFVDGRFVPAASGETFEDIAGRDGRPIASVASGGLEDVDRAVAAARRSFDDRRWSDQKPAARKKVLLRLADLVREHLEELALLESLDVGKPIRDTLNVDVPSCATTLAVVRRDHRQDVRRDRADRARTPCPWSRASRSASSGRSCRGTTRSSSPPGSWARRSRPATRSC